MSDVPPPAAAAPSPWKRYLAFGLPLFAAAGLFYLLLWPRIETSLAINGLASNNPETARDLRRRLLARTDPATEQALLDAVADGDRSFAVRTECVDLLLEKNRLTALESLARAGDRPTRSVIYSRLVRESFFTNEILPDPSYRVTDTVREWLADPRSEGRDRAIALALALDVPDAMQHIRPLLTRAGAEGAGRGTATQTLIGAAGAVRHYRDCASVEQVAALAESDPSIDVRMRVWDDLEPLALGGQGAEPLCPGSLSAERLGALLRGMLHAAREDDFDRALRMRACGLLERHPEHIPPLAGRLRALLDGAGNGSERRGALAALVAGKDPAIGPDMPRYVHDRSSEVRSTAVQVAGRVEGLAAQPLWIGIVRDEAESFEALRQAHLNLKLAAGRFVGLPDAIEALKVDPAEQEKALEGFLHLQFRNGSAEGVAREAWSDAWFRWYARTQGLVEADLERALAARRAFRAAMDRSDLPAARAALADAPAGAGSGRLWLYEEGWLASRS